MIDLRIKLSRRPITYDEFSGLVESMRGWDFVSDVSLLPDSSQIQPAQPQESEERSENSPASPVQQLKAEIAALISDIGEPKGNVRHGIDIRQVIERLRQLSAV